MGILNNTFAAILSVFTLLGCTQKLDTMSRQVPYDLFSLQGTGYEWKELPFPHDNEVVIIDSFEVLEQYISATQKSNRSLPVDFSKHTLLLARGVEPYNNRAAISDLQLLLRGDIVMRIELTPGVASVVTNWQIALITPKLENGGNVLLHVGKKWAVPTMP